MTLRHIPFLTCSGVLVVLLSAALDAGGWAVITVKDLPDYVIAGRPFTLTYAVRQHGRDLLNGLNGRLEIRNGRHLVRAAAAATSEPGHYSASLTLPDAGNWTMDIHSGFGGATGSTSKINIEAIEPDARVPVVTETKRGQRLFAGKGCVTCHVHKNVESGFVPVGPDLTARRYQPAYLQSFLAHPTKTETAKSGSQMPDLDLLASEINSLVAFINQR